MADKPTFFGSLNASSWGFVKGAIALGVIGALGGAIIGTGLGAFGIGVATTTTSFVSLAGAVKGALLGAAIGAASLAELGAVIGTYTGVMQYREAATPSAQDIINVANISFAQGVSVGKNQNISERAAEQVKEAKRHFQETLTQQRGQLGDRTV